jgi:hypothetical protein
MLARGVGLRRLAALIRSGELDRRLHPDHARRGQARVGLAAVIAVQVPHREALVLLVLACADAALGTRNCWGAGRRGVVIGRTGPVVSRRIAVVHPHRRAVLRCCGILDVLGGAEEPQRTVIRSTGWGGGCCARRVSRSGCRDPAGSDCVVVSGTSYVHGAADRELLRGAGRPSGAELRLRRDGHGVLGAVFGVDGPG